MTASSFRLRRGRTAAVAVSAAALLGASIVPAITGAGVASAHPAAARHPATSTVAAHKGPRAVVAGSRYLALGDSVTFGYREPTSLPGTPDYAKASSFVGFPEDVARNLGLKLANAACPGETTASFLDASAQSNGCESQPKGSTEPGYRAVFPLHVTYASKSQSQLAYAEAYLKKHPGTRLVTLMIGANDGFLCQEETSDQCISEIGTVTKKITKNTATIFKGLRKTAGYTGQIAVVTYYATDYTNKTGTLAKLESKAISAAVVAGGKGYDVSVANGYRQFRLASQQAHKSPCSAGLLTVLKGKTLTCGVHTSYAGAALLAQAVERAIKK